MFLEFAAGSFRRLVLTGACSAILLLTFGCYQYQVTGAEDPSVRISADPASIDAGSSTALTVVASNATHVTVAGSNGTSYNLKPSGGIQVVSPSSTVKYTATASSPWSNQTAKAAVSVTVDATSDTKPSVTISASPVAIKPGGASVLTVVAKNAANVVVVSSRGARYTLSRTGGKITVDPKETTKFTVTASGAGGKETASAAVSVTVDVKPSVTITAYPDSIKPGGTSILTVVAKHATEVVIEASSGVRYVLPATGGKKAVAPKGTTRYTVTASGAGGRDTAAVTVTVMTVPRPSLTFSASPASIVAGNSSTLTAVAVHATSVVVTGSNGTRYVLKSDGGTQRVTPEKTTEYTAVASGAGGKVSKSATVTVTPKPTPTVAIAADPATIDYGNSSTLKVTATHATAVTVTGSNGSSYTFGSDGGSEVVDPAKTTKYVATATGPNGEASAGTTITVVPPGSVAGIDHVIFMLQENHTFDDYFGMLNPYRIANKWTVGDDGVTYTVDGIDDKLGKISNEDDEGNSYKLFPFTSTCIDDDSSDWLASYGDINRYDFLMTRPILMDGFVHTAEGYAKSCVASGTCGGNYSDTTGERAMGYYDQSFLNYYYYMASQFAVSDRWFSPVASKSIPNRIATFTGGTTQGLVHDPGGNDHLKQLDIDNIFQELDAAGVSWKIYYTDTQGYCLDNDDCTGGSSKYPATAFSNLTYSYRYLYENPSGAACTPPTQPSSVVGDSGNSFCIDPDHIAPLNPTYFNDLTDKTLPSFAFIEPGYGRNDEHPGSGQSILLGQAEVASIVNSFMASPEWSDSVFFLSYDEGGGPYDHVPPVPGHSNDNTDASLGPIPDISQIAVNPDSYNPCVPSGGTATLHCDLYPTDPGAHAGDAAAEKGFSAQLGFRLPNMVISPFTRRHYVSHTPMDHTAVIKFVENRFIGSAAHLTARDAAQPDLLEFFDFTNIPWATPPTPPAPETPPGPCNPANFAP
jgi:phospholipase C